MISHTGSQEQGDLISQLRAQGVISRHSFTLCLSEVGGYIKLGSTGLQQSGKPHAKIPLRPRTDKSQGHSILINSELTAVRFKNVNYLEEALI